MFSNICTGYYNWKDQSLVDYQNWRVIEGEPSIKWPDGGRGCGYINPDSIEWHDDACDAVKRYACVRPLGKIICICLP